jgi:hypothetical protein
MIKTRAILTEGKPSVRAKPRQPTCTGCTAVIEGTRLILVDKALLRGRAGDRDEGRSLVIHDGDEPVHD